MVREFQRVVGDEAREQCRAILGGDDPELVVACVGGGSNAMGTFAGFIDTAADLVGVEAGGLGLESGQHGASVSRGRSRCAARGAVPLPAGRTRPDPRGALDQRRARLPGCGPGARVSSPPPGRARYEYATDDEAIAGFQLLSVTEGIVPALEPAHALGWLARESGRSVPSGTTVLVTLSGRGDKDAAQIAERLTGERIA